MPGGFRPLAFPKGAVEAAPLVKLHGKVEVRVALHAGYGQGDGREARPAGESLRSEQFDA